MEIPRTTKGTAGAGDLEMGFEVEATWWAPKDWGGGGGWARPAHDHPLCTWGPFTGEVGSDAQRVGTRGGVPEERARDADAHGVGVLRAEAARLRPGAPDPRRELAVDEALEATERHEGAPRG